MDSKKNNIDIIRDFYYSPNGFVSSEKLQSRIKRILNVDIPINEIEGFYQNQLVYQLTRHVQDVKYRCHFRASTINNTHQIDLVYMPLTSTANKYMLNVIDIFSRYVGSRPLKKRDAATVIMSLRELYKDDPYLKLPSIIHVDDGAEFKGVFSKWLQDNNINIKVGTPEIHTNQALIEGFNKTIEKPLFLYMDSVEILLGEGKVYNDWDTILTDQVNNYNNDRQQRLGLSPIEIMKNPNLVKSFEQQWEKIDYKHKLYKVGDKCRLVLPPNRLGRRETDQKWTDDIFEIIEVHESTQYEPAFYRCKNKAGRTLPNIIYFEEIQVINENKIESPPKNILNGINTMNGKKKLNDDVKEDDQLRKPEEKVYTGVERGVTGEIRKPTRYYE